MRLRGGRLCKFWQSGFGSSGTTASFPDRLEALVPAILPSLPIDPYSGRPFGFVRSIGQEVSPLRLALSAAPGNGHPAAPGSWLLYSVGPDGVDHNGFTFKPNVPTPQPMDIVFEIPRLEADDAGTTKGPDQGKDATKDRPVPAKRPAAPGPGH